MAENQMRDVRSIKSILQEFKVLLDALDGVDSIAITPQGQLAALIGFSRELIHFKRNGEIEKTIVMHHDCTKLTAKDENFIVSHDGAIGLLSPEGEYIKDLVKLNSGSQITGLVHQERLFVSELCFHRISVYNMDGELQHRFGSKGSEPGQFDQPGRMCVGPDNFLYVCDRMNDRVQVLEKDGTFVRQIGGGVLKEPTGIAVTKDGYLAVTSNETFGARNKKISFFTLNGKCVHEVEDLELIHPGDIVVDKNEFIYVNDFKKIIKL